MRYSSEPSRRRTAWRQAASPSSISSISISLHGHRRDVAGYAAALEHFDRRLPELLARLRPGDVAILTADHGCDPTWAGSDHTRECVPVLAFGPDLDPGPIGRRSTFADIGQTVAEVLEVAPLASGTAWRM